MVSPSIDSGQACRTIIAGTAYPTGLGIFKNFISGFGLIQAKSIFQENQVKYYWRVVVEMWNIRMRASQNIESQEIHISGAEGIFEENELSKMLGIYLKRALNHSRGKPDKIYFTIENFKQIPIKISPLIIKNLICNSPKEARELITERLLNLNITKDAILHAFSIIDSNKTMRGAAIISATKVLRFDPNIERGIRVSRLGIDRESDRKFNRILKRLKINNSRVKEALTLASKVAYHVDVKAELCISDDPDYTTGYIASKELGYLRIANIKNSGDRKGGRIFFINEGADIFELINYLEKMPVLVNFENY